VIEPALLSVLEDYHRRYVGRDVEGVTDLCLWPFVAIRKEKAVHLPDRVAVRDHFAAVMGAYRITGYGKWTAVEKQVHELGEHAVYLTVHWLAEHKDGVTRRDTRTSYHLLKTSAGWRFLSYMNHF
jgi:hypothetical protein